MMHATLCLSLALDRSWVFSYMQGYSHAVLIHMYNNGMPREQGFARQIALTEADKIDMLSCLQFAAYDVAGV